MRTIALIAVLGATALASSRTRAQQAGEAAYMAARDSAIAALAARTRGGEKYPMYMPSHDSALKSLGRRLETIIGPVRAKGFSRTPQINLEDLFPQDLGYGKLDALLFRGDDREGTLWVTTPSLVDAWLALQGPRRIPSDRATALQTPDFYTFAIEYDVAVYDFGSFTVPDARQLGIVEAMMMNTGQDDRGRAPPSALLMTVERRGRIYILTTPLAVIIEPSRRCLKTLDSLYALGDQWRAQTAGRPATASDSGPLPRLQKAPAEPDSAFRRCYGEQAPSDPRFQRIVEQVRSIALGLP